MQTMHSEPTLRKSRILRYIVLSIKTGIRNWKIPEKAVYLEKIFKDVITLPILIQHTEKMLICI